MREFVFRKARPIWAKNREKEMNCELAFRTVLPKSRLSGQNRVIYLATSGVYRLLVNGELVMAGPARAAAGYFRADQKNLDQYLIREQNVLVVEAVGYNVNTYDVMDQPSFLIAEIVSGDSVLAWTSHQSFGVYDLGQRVQKVQRYSFQRAFGEAYRLKSGLREFYTLPEYGHPRLGTAVQAGGRFIEREAREPEYEVLQSDRILETGSARFGGKRENPLRYESYVETGAQIKGFRPQELDICLSDEAQSILFGAGKGPSFNIEETELDNGYSLYAFPYNATGFLRIRAECRENCVVFLLFDEILSGSDVDFLRMGSCNCFYYALDAGSHMLTTIAPYTMKYLKVAVKGKCLVRRPEIVEYKHPETRYHVKLPKDLQLRTIYDAAVETFRANAVDLFTDCPSRERSGWLCDSFFTARTEYVLTGESRLEKVFLENFLLPGSFPHLPEGMLPMCYPADHNNGNFIPNWAMWFVLELEEYVVRSGDHAFKLKAKEKIYALLAYFEKFENEWGLLENLEKWVFVEWSRANDPDAVQGVNFPTNMLYRKMLMAVSRLYGDKALMEKAGKLRSVIRQRSYDGSFFTDNEKRAGAAGMANPGIRTEVCQYYAFFTGIATREEDGELWNILLDEFGPGRKRTGTYPQVAFANMFIGNYLRMELLYREGYFGRFVNDVKEYFFGMAQRTGTLWEFDSARASCNHGFASCVIYWLAGIYGAGSD